MDLLHLTKAAHFLSAPVLLNIRLGTVFIFWSWLMLAKPYL